MRTLARSEEICYGLNCAPPNGYKNTLHPALAPQNVTFIRVIQIK